MFSEDWAVSFEYVPCLQSVHDARELPPGLALYVPVHGGVRRGKQASCLGFTVRENRDRAQAFRLACGTGLAKGGLVGVLVVPGKARGTGPRPGIAAEAASKALVALRGAYHKVVPRWRWCRRRGRGTPLHAARALGVRAIEGKVILLQENGQTLSHI